LETVRHLKSIGVEVRFEKEGIHSFSEDGELMFRSSLLSRRKKAQHFRECEMGYPQAVQERRDWRGQKHILGYQDDEEQKSTSSFPKKPNRSDGCSECTSTALPCGTLQIT
jgi:hypothetical protein